MWLYLYKFHASSTLVPMCVVTVHIRDVTYTNWFFTSLLIFGQVKIWFLILDFSGYMHRRTLRLFLLAFSGIVLSDFAIKTLHWSYSLRSWSNIKVRKKWPLQGHSCLTNISCSDLLSVLCASYTEKFNSLSLDKENQQTALQAPLKAAVNEHSLYLLNFF